MKKLLLSAVVVFAAATAFAADKAEKGAKKDAAKETHVTPDQLKWMQPFGDKGPNIAMVEGTFGDKHPATFFVKMPAGAESPWHIHDEDYQAVVLKGTFTETQQGDAAATNLPMGTYFTQTGKANHKNGCVAGGDECIVMVHFNKNANSKMTSPEGKLLPPPPADKK